MIESPELVQLTTEGALHKKKYGIGLNLVNEKAGIFSKTSFSGALRYAVKITGKHEVLFGIAGGFQRQTSDFSKIKADAPEELAQWPQQQAVTVPDASIGFIYRTGRFLITAAATQILQSNFLYREPVHNKELQYKTISQFIFSIQHTFGLKNKNWSYTPHLTARTPMGLPFQLDFVNTITYKAKILAGVGYRYNRAVYSNLGFNINNRLRIIYSYEYSLGIQQVTKGGHELGLTFGLMSGNHRSNEDEGALKQAVVDEIFEKLDKHDQQVESLSKKIDSLDKNLLMLKYEIESLKNKQVTHDELIKAIDGFFTDNKAQKLVKDNVDQKTTSSNSINTHGKYKVINPKSESEFEQMSDSVNANYKIVFGVYQQSYYAKEYQKFLQRELDCETKLVQLHDHPKKFIYVCSTKEFCGLKEAMTDLRQMRKKIKGLRMEITKGEAWVLQTLNK